MPKVDWAKIHKAETSQGDGTYFSPDAEGRIKASEIVDKPESTPPDNPENGGADFWRVIAPLTYQNQFTVTPINSNEPQQIKLTETDTADFLQKNDSESQERRAELNNQLIKTIYGDTEPSADNKNKLLNAIEKWKTDSIESAITSRLNASILLMFPGQALMDTQQTLTKTNLTVNESGDIKAIISYENITITCLNPYKTVLIPGSFTYSVEFINGEYYISSIECQEEYAYLKDLFENNQNAKSIIAKNLGLNNEQKQAENKAAEAVKTALDIQSQYVSLLNDMGSFFPTTIKNAYNSLVSIFNSVIDFIASGFKATQNLTLGKIPDTKQATPKNVVTAATTKTTEPPIVNQETPNIENNEELDKATKQFLQSAETLNNQAKILHLINSEITNVNIMGALPHIRRIEDLIIDIDGLSKKQNREKSPAENKFITDARSFIENEYKAFGVSPMTADEYDVLETNQEITRYVGFEVSDNKDIKLGDTVQQRQQAAEDKRIIRFATLAKDKATEVNNSNASIDVKNKYTDIAKRANDAKNRLNIQHTDNVQPVQPNQSVIMSIEEKSLRNISAQRTVKEENKKLHELIFTPAKTMTPEEINKMISSYEALEKNNDPTIAGHAGTIVDGLKIIRDDKLRPQSTQSSIIPMGNVLDKRNIRPPVKTEASNEVNTSPQKDKDKLHSRSSSPTIKAY